MARRPRRSKLRRRRIVAITSFFLQLVSVYVTIITNVCQVIALKMGETRIRNQPIDTLTERHNTRMKVSDVKSLNWVRMNRFLFRQLCELLFVEGGLERTHEVDIDEMVVTFLCTIANNKKNRILADKLRRSGETISRNIHKVLLAILKLNKILLKAPVPIHADSTDARWKYFKNCVGALDGTHIKVRVVKELQTRYRDRKSNTSINVLGVCNPDLEFIYCLSGWEGSAHDGSVLRDALSRPNGLRVAEGTYYLCDAGYSNSPGFLTPYRGQRYHLKEWGVNSPVTPEEYYNMKHAGARNVIERVFGILKMCWAILRDTTWFSTRVITNIINACVLLHNFIKRGQGVDFFERTYRDIEPEDHPSVNVESIEDENVISNIQPSPEWTQLRNAKAVEMWENRSRR